MSSPYATSMPVWVMLNVSAWRSQALHVLDQVIRLDSKRAKPADRERFDRAGRERT
ncbi:Uncharacterised protein [Enterobacter cloacae]|uniref:Uncharacterized protein n=1 Tax=Enterobacter cloacae TaxID=550 RepID=A0A377M7V6_ENTCL|nr:Uncharacterised protein [Enterobacter cloacae]